MWGHVLKYHILVLLMMLTVFSFSASAQVDWENGVVRAKGTGLPSPDMPEVQAKLLAKRAAMSDAYRNLAEMVNAVQVTSETVVKNFVTESDEIHTRVQAFIQGALVVDEKQNDDGSYEVLLEAPVYGVGSLSDFIIGEVAKKSEQYPYQQAELISESENYTGLVIDARGVDVNPALAPTVFNVKAEIVYDASLVKKEVYQQNGIASFVNGSQDEDLLEGRASLFLAMDDFTEFDVSWMAFPLRAALKNKKITKKAGSNPLIVKAVDPKTTPVPVVNLGSSSLVVSAEDGKKIVSSNSINSFLDNGSVVVLTGNKTPLENITPANDVVDKLTSCPKGMRKANGYCVYE